MSHHAEYVAPACWRRVDGPDWLEPSYPWPKGRANQSKHHPEVLDCGGLLTVSTLSKQKSTHIYQAATGDWVNVAPQSTEFIREGDAIGMCFGEKHFTVAKEATTAVQPPAEFRGLSRSSDEPCPPSKQRRLSSAEPTLVVVLGYQGAGKSTLVRKLIDMVPALDWTVNTKIHRVGVS